jgi:hypothetical protein
MYLELKSGHNDSGPAWVSLVSFSRSGETVYFNGKAIKRIDHGGIGVIISTLRPATRRVTE